MGPKDVFLKILQETAEKKWLFTSFAQMEGVIRRPESPRQVVLLLHGLGERGKRIFRKLLPYLPANALVIAPNGPFPLPRVKENRMSYGHSWYFYDKFERTYFINQDLAKYWLRDLLKMENPESLPVTIIGFSQGGYLAPLVGKEISETKHVIGLACEFRTTLIHEKLPFTMDAIHGEKDEIIPLNMAYEEKEKLSPLGMKIGWFPLGETAHEITSEMGETVKKVLESYGK